MDGSREDANEKSLWAETLGTLNRPTLALLYRRESIEKQGEFFCGITKNGGRDSSKSPLRGIQ